jgi:hypothetical protein
MHVIRTRKQHPLACRLIVRLRLPKATFAVPAVPLLEAPDPAALGQLGQLGQF